MISGAEAHRISRALESVAGWTSEIIIVLNDDVTDATEEVAARFGVKVYREPWKGHVAQKNSAADKAASDWILGLDADEVVSPELRAEIQQALQNPRATTEPAAFSFPRCTFYGGRWIRHGDWYPDRQTRLWRRGRARWGGIGVHDKLAVDGSVGRLRSDLFHFSMESMNHLIRKTVAYSDEFVRQCAQRGRRVSYARVVFHPLWRFVRGYFLRLGFLDGWQGWSIAWLGAFYTFLRYAKAHEAQIIPAENHAPTQR